MPIQATPIRRDTLCRTRHTEAKEQKSCPSEHVRFPLESGRSKFCLEEDVEEDKSSGSLLEEHLFRSGTLPI